MNDILIIIICFVNLFLWIFFFLYFRKRFSSQEMLENIRQEVDKILIEINKETDDDLTLLEAKVNELKDLMTAADERIVLLRKEGERHDKETVVMNRIQQLNDQIEDIYTVNRKAAIYQESRVQESVEEQLQLFSPRIQETSPAQEKNEEPEQNEKPEMTLKDKVLDLWKLGFDSNSISEKLSVSLTEIQMIIDMFG